jgi:hypothetical protein
MRQTPTLPYQLDGRDFPASPSAGIPLPDYPDVGLSIDFCRNKLKKKFELVGNGHKVWVAITTLLFVCIR